MAATTSTLVGHLNVASCVRANAITSAGSIANPGRAVTIALTVAPAVAGHADHRDLIHPRERGERLFDLGGIDVLAAADDSVGGAIDEVQPAVPVAAAQIAGAQPTVGREGPRGFIRLVPVADEILLGARPDLSHLPIGDVITGIG